ncbi:MAG: glycosyltransferase family 4 protein, partial [Anaerolineae bacterium]
MTDPVAIDYTPALEQGGGIGRYTRELIRALAAGDRQTPYRLFAAGRHNLPPLPGSNFQWKTTPLSTEWLARIWHRARIPLRVERFTGEVAIYHATNFTLPPLKQATRALLTVHDLSFIKAPETATPGLRAYLNNVVPQSIARADHILADSEATRQDVIDIYSTPADKVSVLYCGVEDRFQPVIEPGHLQHVRDKYAIGDRPFILSVGTVQPRKNYIRLVDALHRLNQPGLKLLIAGGKGWLDDPLHEHIRTLGMGRQVQFLGFVDDEDLPALYSAARVFAFP